MKKNVLSALCLVLVVMSLTSCGKNAQESSQNTTQDTSVTNDTDSKNNDETIDVLSILENDSHYLGEGDVVEALPEICNANFWDSCFQYGNAFIQYDNSMTIRELMSILKEKSGYSEIYLYSPDNSYVLDSSFDVDEKHDNSLPAGESFCLWVSADPNCSFDKKERDFSVIGINNSLESIDPFDALITGLCINFVLDEKNGRNILNIYYPTGLNAGLYSNSIVDLSDKEKEKLSKLQDMYPTLNINSFDYESVIEEAKDKGLEVETESSPDCEYILFYDPQIVLYEEDGPFGKVKFVKAVEWYLDLDEDSGDVTNIWYMITSKSVFE